MSLHREWQIEVRYNGNLYTSHTTGGQLGTRDQICPDDATIRNHERRSQPSSMSVTHTGNLRPVRVSQGDSIKKETNGRLPCPVMPAPPRPPIPLLRHPRPSRALPIAGSWAEAIAALLSSQLTTHSNGHRSEYLALAKDPSVSKIQENGNEKTVKTASLVMDKPLAHATATIPRVQVYDLLQYRDVISHGGKWKSFVDEYEGGQITKSGLRSVRDNPVTLHHRTYRLSCRQTKLMTNDSRRTRDVHRSFPDWSLEGRRRWKSGRC